MAPTKNYSSPLRTATLFILPLLSLLGMYGGYVLGGSNGTFETITALLKNETSSFPGTAERQLKTFTTLSFVDRQLAVLITFFAPVVDHEHPSLGLFSLNGLGLIGAAWTLLVMEGLRSGNRGRAVAYVGTVGAVFQNISFQVTIPLYLFFHVLTSPLATPSPAARSMNSHLINTLDLKILPWSIILSYIIPSVLMTLPAPSMVSVSMHQYLIAFWQPFPIWTIVIQWTIRQFFSSGTSRATAVTSANYLIAAKQVYQFAFPLCILTHLPVLLLSLIPSKFLAPAFPELTKLAESDFVSVYVPYIMPSQKVRDLADGVLTFLQWDMYVGSAAFLLWAVLLYHDTVAEQSASRLITKDPASKYTSSDTALSTWMLWRKIISKIVVWSAVAGPVGAATMLIWERDIVLGKKIKGGI